MKRYWWILFLLLASQVEAQQIPQFTQRNLNIFSYNPAFAGVKSHSEILLHHRSQWTEFEGAPITQSVVYHGMLNRIMGFGFSAIRDVIGPISTMGAKLAYAHHIDLEIFKWSLGLSGEIYQYGLDGRDLNPHQPGDQALLLELSDKVWRPEASFGTFIYNEHFFLSYSILQLLGSTVQLYDDPGIYGTMPLARHHYISAGYSFSPMSNIDVEPSVLWAKAKGSPFQLEVNLNAQYMQMFMLGTSFRWNDAIALTFGFKVFDRLKMTYSYDIVYSPLRNYQSGSHELILSYILPNRSGKWNRWRHEYQYEFNPKTNRWRERW